MVNYNNSKIYKIVDNTNNNIYIGSTTKKYLSTRLSEHKSKYKRFLEGKSKSGFTSFDIIKNNDYDIILLELVICNSKCELHKKERYYIETLDCINNNIPGRTRKEYQKEYIKDNKDKLKEYQKKYRKKYYENYKDKTLRHQKELRIYKSSWGGNMIYDNNLLRIDVNLFA